MRVCHTCGVSKNINDFHRKGTTHEWSCKECESENNRTYRESHKEEIGEKKRMWHATSIRNRFRGVVDGYGGKCVECGESRLEALILHHRNGGGMKHRVEVGRTGAAFYSWVLKNRFPQELELLCGTCHLIKHRNELSNWSINKIQKGE